MKIVVIGSGIAGSSAARIARERGHKVVLIDKNPQSSASRVALATIRPSWYSQEDKNLIDRSWNFYERWGAAITKTAIVSDWKNPSKSQEQDGWWLADPIIPLLEPDICSKVVAVNETSVITDTAGEISGDAIYIATGVHDEAFYSDFVPYSGATLISQKATVIGSKLRVHKLRPYYDLTAGMTSDGCRLGSSISKNPDKAVDDAWKMLDVANKMGIVTNADDWKLVLHFRAKPIGGKFLRPDLGKSVVKINGLHRSGYGLCPALADQWIRSIE